jgi:hypothetical protein
MANTEYRFNRRLTILPSVRLVLNGAPASRSCTDLLVLDDWGLAAFTDLARRDLLEIFDDRHELRSTLVTSQLPVEHWHDNLGDPTLADAILDRLAHNAHRIALAGESMRKKKSATAAAHPTGSTQAADRQR